MKKTVFNPEKMLAAFFILTSAVLSVEVYREWNIWQQWKPIAQTQNQTSTETPLLQLKQEPNIDLGTLSILERPLFRAGRRPAAVPAAGVSAMKKGQFLLAGVIIAGGERIALLEDVATGKPERARLGGQIRGMTIQSVEPDRIAFEQNGDTEVLTLKIRTAPSPKVEQPASSESKPSAIPQTGSIQVSPRVSARPVMKTPSLEKMKDGVKVDQEEFKAKRREQIERINKNRAARGIPPIQPPPE